MNLARYAIAAALLLSAAPAGASILGDQGVEIEGPHDRRGFYWKPSAAFGLELPGHSFNVTTVRIDLELGAGAGKDLTIGVQGGPAWLFGDVTWVGIHADLIVRGFVGQGLFLQAGAGVAPLPRVESGVLLKPTTGVGGQLGAGYEVWTGVSSTFGIGLGWDGRADSDSVLVSAVLAHAYLAFY